MVKVRLSRVGGKKEPFYRVVVSDERSPRDGRFIEQIGTYDPSKKPFALKVEKERVDYWLGKGAQPSESVKRLLQALRRQEEQASPT